MPWDTYSISKVPAKSENVNQIKKAIHECITFLAWVAIYSLYNRQPNGFKKDSHTPIDNCVYEYGLSPGIHTASCVPSWPPLRSGTRTCGTWGCCFWRSARGSRDTRRASRLHTRGTWQWPLEKKTSATTLTLLETGSYQVDSKPCFYRVESCQMQL